MTNSFWAERRKKYTMGRSTPNDKAERCYSNFSILVIFRSLIDSESTSSCSCCSNMNPWHLLKLVIRPPSVAHWKRICWQCRRHRRLRRHKFDPLGQEDPLEKEMAPYSSIFAWKIPWAEEPGRLQFIGSQRVRHK